MQKKRLLVISLIVLVFLITVFFTAKLFIHPPERSGECKIEVLTENSILGKKGETVTICP